MKLNEFIQTIFHERKVEDEGVFAQELNSMSNSIPPTYPTFIIGQTYAKRSIQLKLQKCIKHGNFERIILNAKFGGGKTHFINWIKSGLALVEDNDVYGLQFRVEDTVKADFSFTKMILMELFSNYYDEFYLTFEKIKNEWVSNNGYPKNVDEAVAKIASDFNIDAILSKVLYQFIVAKSGTEKGVSLRVLGASQGSQELRKFGLRINNITENHYLSIIRLFTEYSISSGFLIILLDEFEHAYLALKPSAKRKFLLSYKQFIDKVGENSLRILLITAVTEQSEGELKKGINEIDSALWSRLETSILTLDEFELSNNEQFEELYKKLSTRYKLVYGFDISFYGASQIRTKVLEKIGTNSTQNITYRKAVTNILAVMDDMYAQGITLDGETSENATKIKKEKSNNILNRNEVSEVRNKWDKLKKPQKAAQIKSSLETFFRKEYNVDFMRPPFLKSQVSHVLYFEQDDRNIFCYIAIVNDSYELQERFNECEKYHDRSINENKITTSYFIYQKEKEISSLQNLLTDVNLISLDFDSWNELILYKDLQGEALDSIHERIKKSLVEK